MSFANGNHHNNHHLDYPSLTSCQIRVVGPGGATRPPVRLSREIRESAALPPNGTADLDAVDGFQLERAVLRRREERERDRPLRKATSKEELERATIARMKSVTGADEDVCIATLRDHNYDVKESIEAYLEKL